MTDPNIIPKLCETGSPCPVSGIWESLGLFRTTIVVSKSSKMPHYCGKKVVWKLVEIG